MYYLFGFVLILSGLMISDDFLRRKFPSLRDIFEKLTQVKLIFGVVILIGTLYLLVQMIFLSFTVFIVYGYILVLLFLNAVLIVTPSFIQLAGDANDLSKFLITIDNKIRPYSDPIGWITFAHGLFIIATTLGFMSLLTAITGIALSSI
jgi:hypothetical protein